jgi:hypothetical protein
MLTDTSQSDVFCAYDEKYRWNEEAKEQQGKVRNVN